MDQTPLRLSDRLFGCVSFALFCAEHKVRPQDLAQLLACAQRRKSAWERSTWDASTSDRYVKQSERWTERVEELATKMGFGVDWPGLWPVLTKGGHDYYLPEV